MNFRKFRKSAKALSPVIATIILIAVTVAVSVVVAAWMGALTIGFMGNSEQASITSVTLTNDANPDGGGTVVCQIQNTGSASVTIKSASVDGLLGTATYTVTSAPTPIPKGSSGTVTVVIASGSAANTNPFVNTAQYTIRLQTAKGNTLVSQVSYTGP
jgi:flagellin-like protein